MEHHAVEPLVSVASSGWTSVTFARIDLRAIDSSLPATKASAAS